MSKLDITVARNPTNNFTLLHEPVIRFGDGGAQPSKCRTGALLDRLKLAGASDEAINRAQREIEETGRTVIELNGMTDEDFQGVVSECCRQEAEELRGTAQSA